MKLMSQLADEKKGEIERLLVRKKKKGKERLKNVNNRAPQLVHIINKSKILF